MRTRIPLTTAALWRARDGVAAMEFALVVPVLITLMTGAISFGVAFRMKMEVGNAARAGAVYASANVFNQANIVAAAQAATALSTTVTVTAAKVTSSCMDPGTGKIESAALATICPGTGSPPGTYVTVNTQMTYTFILALPGIGTSKTLTGIAVARLN